MSFLLYYCFVLELLIPRLVPLGGVCSVVCDGKVRSFGKILQESFEYKKNRLHLHYYKEFKSAFSVEMTSKQNFILHL